MASDMPAIEGLAQALKWLIGCEGMSPHFLASFQSKISHNARKAGLRS